VILGETHFWASTVVGVFFKVTGYFATKSCLMMHESRYLSKSKRLFPAISPQESQYKAGFHEIHGHSLEFRESYLRSKVEEDTASGSINYTL
jgi:hypothetical protein